jgi:2,4'-dihydroxyacetophenone dioxygenase
MEDAAGVQDLIGRFDDRNVRWMPYPGVEGMALSILHVDEARNSADFLIRFAPNTKSVVHRHLAVTHIFVVEGDHVIYEPDGTVRESRPTGRYTAGMGGGPHDEGGGPNGAVIFYSVRGETGALFEVHDPAGNPAAVIRIGDLRGLLDAAA